MLLRKAIAEREPELRRMLLLAAVFAVPAYLATQLPTATDPDIWWRLRTGQWIWAQRGVPVTEPFSAFGAGAPWVEYSWLFEAALYIAYRLGGLLGVVIFKSCIVAAITGAVYRLVGRLQRDFTWRVVLTSLAMTVMTPLYTPRPWLLTVLFFVLEFDALLAYRMQPRLRTLYILGPIFVLWANIHIQFAYGLFLLAAFAVEPRLKWMTTRIQGRPTTDTVRAAPLWWATLACAALILVNPYGIKVYDALFELLGQSATFRYIMEFQPLSFRHYLDFVLLAMMLAAVFALGRVRRADVPQYILLLTASLLALRASRDAWFLAVVATATLAASIPPRTAERWMPTARQRAWIAAAVVSFFLAGMAVKGIDNAQLAKQAEKEMPIAAADYVARHQLRGPLFNDFNWGGYLIWRLPALPVSMDGRTPVHGDERIERSVATWAGRDDWASDPDLIAAQLVIGPRSAALSSILRLSPDFEVAYEDREAVVFQRKAMERAATDQAAGENSTTWLRPARLAR